MKMMRTILVASLSLAVMSCGLFGEKKKKGSKEDDQEDTPIVQVEATVAEDGSVKANLKVDSENTQKISFGKGSAFEGGSIAVPPGALSVATELTVGKGEELVDASLIKELGIEAKEEAKGATAAFSISSKEEKDPVQPLVGSIPLGSTLLADGQLTVLYRVQKFSEDGKFFVGAIPTSQLKVVDGVLEFPIAFFGVYQPMYVKSEVKKDPVSEEKESETPPSVFKAGELTAFEYSENREPMSFLSNGNNYFLAIFEEIEGTAYIYVHLWDKEFKRANDGVSIYAPQSRVVATLSEGGYSFCYASEPMNLTGSNVFCQKMSDDGTTSTNHSIANDPNYQELEPVAMSYGGEKLGVLVRYEEITEEQEDVEHYYFHLVDKEVTVSSDKILVASYALEAGINLEGEKIFTTWMMDEKGKFEIWGRFFNFDGTPSGEAFAIAKPGIDIGEDHTQIHLDHNDGNYFVTWGLNNVEGSKFGYAIVGRDGAVKKLNNEYLKDQPKKSYSNVMAYDKYFVSQWIEFENNKTSSQARYVSLDGEPLGEQFKIMDMDDLVGDQPGEAFHNIHGNKVFAATLTEGWVKGATIEIR